MTITKYLCISLGIAIYCASSHIHADEALGYCHFTNSGLAADQEDVNQGPDKDGVLFTAAAHRYVDKVTPKDTLIDVRASINPLHPAPSIVIRGALVMPLFSLKTKSYLKNKRLVLVGDGLDYYGLEKTVTELERLRFRFVRILRHGVLALPNKQLGVSSSTYEHQLVGVRQVVSAAIRQPSDFHFIRLDAASDTLDYFGFNYTRLASANDPHSNLASSIDEQVRQLRLNSPDLRIVIVSPNSMALKNLFEQSLTVRAPGILFVDEGTLSFDSIYRELSNRVKSLPHRPCAS